jgi:hypothetical protein
MPRPTRRDFARAATAAGVATALSAGRVLGANGRVRLGFIGLGNRGDQVLDAFLAHKDAEVVAVCDIHAPYREFAAKKAGGNPDRLHDYRKLLDRNDVDAVVIATPDHWHALQTVHACRAGKDVYVEKPLSLCVAEGRAMVRAARDHKRVVQCGIQRLSSPMAAEAAEVVRSGGIGKVTAVRCFHVQNEWPAGIGRPKDEDPPEGFDWDGWLGRPRSGGTTRTARSTGSAGSTTTPAGSSPTSACITWPRSTAPSGPTPRGRWWPSAGSSPTTTTARCRTRWRSSGTTPATCW